MEAEDLGLDTHRDLQGVYRYYELAKRAEWQVRDLPWGEIPPIPEYSGSPQKLARRRDLWRSVVTQQLQADELAVEMATQLFWIAPHRGVAQANRRGRRHDGTRPAPRPARAHDARRRHAGREGLRDAGVLRATDHPAVPDDRAVVTRDDPRRPLQPADDRRRHS